METRNLESVSNGNLGTSENRPGAATKAGMHDILKEIETERQYQKDKWGSDVDLRINTPMDFVGYIAYHSGRWFDGGFRPYPQATLEAFRKQMIKVATLAVAAIEHVDAILANQVDRPDVLQK
jgi:hypothetical protein